MGRILKETALRPNRPSGPRLSGFTLFLAFGTLSLSERAFGPLAPFIRSDLQLTEAQIGILGGSMMFGSLFASLPTAAAIDRFDTRRALATSMLALGIALMLASAQTTFRALFIALFLVGLVRSGVIPLINKSAALNAEGNRRGRVLGVIQSAAPAASFVGALIFPRVAASAGWGASFLLLGIAALPVALAVAIVLSEKPKSSDRAPSLRQAVRKLRPLLSISMLYGVYVSTMFAVRTFLVLFLVDVMHYSAILAGTFFALTQLTAVVGRIIWGRLADRIDRIRLMIVNAAITVLTYWLLSILGIQSPAWVVVLLMIALGAGVLSSWALQSVLIIDVAGSQSTAGGTAFTLFFLALFGIAGPVLFGFGLEYTRSYAVTFRMLGGVAAFAAIGFALNSRSRRGGSSRFRLS